MKKTLIFIFLIGSLNLFAQKIKQPLVFSKFDEITLTFRNDSVLKGLGQMNTLNEIIFKKNKKDKKVVYDYKTVKKATFKFDNKEKVFVYKIDREQMENNIKLVEWVVSGKVSLYKIETIASGGFKPNLNAIGGMSLSYTPGFNTIKYYISKKKH